MAKMRMKAKALFMTVPFRLRPGRGVQEAETQVRRGSAAAMRSTSAYCCDMAGADRTGWWGYLPPLRQSRAGRQSDNRGERKSVVEGKSVSVRVDIGGRGLLKKKTKTQ